MTPKARFIKSIIATTQTQEVEMPWTRGARRAAMIERRLALQTPRQARTA